MNDLNWGTATREHEFVENVGTFEQSNICIFHFSFLTISPFCSPPLPDELMLLSLPGS